MTQSTAHEFGKAARAVEQTEKLTKLPVRMVWDDSLNVGAIVHLSEIEYSKQIRISVKPGRDDTDYLIASQCGSAIRHFQHGAANLVAVEGAIKTVERQFTALGHETDLASKQATYMMQSLGGQLRGTPASLSISTWIHREFPELHDSQHIHFKSEASEGAKALQLTTSQFPEWTLRSHQMMNGTIALVSDYLFSDPTFSAHYRDTDLEPVISDLFNIAAIQGSEESDKELVNKWIERMDLSRYFTWTEEE